MPDFTVFSDTLSYLSGMTTISFFISTLSGFMCIILYRKVFANERSDD